MGSVKMTEEEVLSILGNVCKVPPEQLKPETHLIHDLNLDSVLTMQLLMSVEDRLGREISEVEAADLVTVGDVVALVSA